MAALSAVLINTAHCDCESSSNNNEGSIERGRGNNNARRIERERGNNKNNNNSKNSLLQITKALDFRSTKRITVRVALGTAEAHREQE